ncbi:MAG: hypothetical protein WHV67_05040, partial [Thermoanaerobaculia bacterium]
MKKIFAIFILFLAACLKQIPEKGKIPQSFLHIIEKIPPARISIHEKLIFDFTFDIPEAETMRELNAAKIFQFSPPLEGNCWWERKDALAFSPFGGFEPGKNYKCRLNLSLLSQKFSDYPPLEISFSVLENEILYFKNSFERDISSPDQDRQILNAAFLMTKKNIKIEEAKEGIKVLVNGNPLDFSLKKTEDIYELKAPFSSPEYGGEIKIEFDKDKLKLEKPISYHIPLAPLKKFRVEEIEVIWEEGEAKVQLKFSHSLKEEENFEIYIRTEPLMDLNFFPQGNILKISGDFKHNIEYKLTILPGLPNFQGEKLKEEQIFNFRLKDIPPEIKIVQDKIYLSSKSNKNIRFESVNIKNLDLSIYYI